MRYLENDDTPMAAEIPAFVRAALFYRSVQLKKRIYIAMYRKYMGTYEGTDKSRSPGITNLNSLPEGRGPL